MPLSINTNLESLVAQRSTALNANSLATSMQRLASGLRVNTGADDAAGLAIGARFDAQVRGMGVGMRNANDGISLLQTADATMSAVSDLMQRMRELAIQALTQITQVIDVASLDNEYIALNSELQRSLSASQFNGTGLYGANAKTLSFQVGANVRDVLSVTVNQAALGSNILGDAPHVNDVNDINGNEGVFPTGTTVNSLDHWLGVIDSERAVLGASINRIGAAVANLQSGSATQAAARSRILDADFATETAAFSRVSILQRAGDAMVAQANQRPRQVLALLGQ